MMLVYHRRAYIHRLCDGIRNGGGSRRLVETSPNFRLYNLQSSRVNEFHLHDSLSESSKSIFEGSIEKGLAWYTCGPTTYAPAHLGHARTYVCLDIIRRVLEHQSIGNGLPPPLFVMNITDVDDKIIASSKESGENPIDLARKFESEFWRDLDALNCLRPHIVTRVSEHVDSDIIPYIQEMYESGMAYEMDDGIYFDLKSFEEKLRKVTKYGKLAPPSVATDFFSNASNQSKNSELEKKRDARDFVLWKKRKNGESLYWDSPWGEGRPGWHIECSAMIEAVSRAVKDTHEFRFHAGGVDLKFPHHTNEIAQAEAYHSIELNLRPKEWIQHWIHTGHLHIDGAKMSKSLKNFITIEDLLKKDSLSPLSSPADDFRLWCMALSGPYRSPATFSWERMNEAKSIREKIANFLADGSNRMKKADSSKRKKWKDSDFDLYYRINRSMQKAYDSIANDLDGFSFLQEMITIIDDFYDHCSLSSVSPSELINHCIRSIRSALALVGFSNKFVHAGSLEGDSLTTSQTCNDISILEELATFRKRVRDVSLVSLKDGLQSERNSEVLKMCDHLRDRLVAMKGVQLIDGDDEVLWRYCIPHDINAREEKASSCGIHSSQEVVDIPINELFKVGRYEGLFAEYDVDGFPIKNADGSIVSNRQKKKLLTKKQKHLSRIIKKEEETIT